MHPELDIDFVDETYVLRDLWNDHDEVPTVFKTYTGLRRSALSRRHIRTG
jgi:hypothetical protein